MRWGLHGSDLFVQQIPQMLDWIEIWGIWRPSQHLELVVLFLNHSWTIFALRQDALSCWKMPLPSGKTVSMKVCVYGLQQWLKKKMKFWSEQRQSRHWTPLDYKKDTCRYKLCRVPGSQDICRKLNTRHTDRHIEVPGIIRWIP